MIEKKLADIHNQKNKKSIAYQVHFKTSISSSLAKWFDEKNISYIHPE